MLTIETIVPGFPVNLDPSKVVDAKAMRMADGVAVKLEMANENFVMIRADQADELVDSGFLPRQLQGAWRPNL